MQHNKEPPSTMPWDKLPSAVDPSEGIMKQENCLSAVLSLY